MVERGRAQESCGEGKGLWVSYTRQAEHAPGVRGAGGRGTKGASDGGAESRGVRKRLAHGRAVAARWNRQSRRPWAQIRNEG
jgi:hypothetical protein